MHPQLPSRAMRGKLFVLFLSVEKIGSTASHGVTTALEEIAWALFRLLLWRPSGGAIYLLVTSKTSPAPLGGIFSRAHRGLRFPLRGWFRPYTPGTSAFIYLQR